MFSELMPLFPSTKGMIIMTVAKVDDLHLRVSFHPAADDAADKPQLTAFAIEGTPAELDQPGINFAPLIEASKTINQQITAAAEARKAEPAKVAAPVTPAPPAPPAKSKPGTKARPTGPAAAPAPAATPAPAPVIAAPVAAPTPPGDLRARLAALQAGGRP